MTRAERRAAEAAGARRDREAARQRAGGTGVWEQGARAARRPGPASLGRRPQLGGAWGVWFAFRHFSISCVLNGF